MWVTSHDIGFWPTSLKSLTLEQNSNKNNTIFYLITKTTSLLKAWYFWQPLRCWQLWQIEVKYKIKFVQTVNWQFHIKLNLLQTQSFKAYVCDANFQNYFAVLKSLVADLFYSMTIIRQWQSIRLFIFQQFFPPLTWLSHLFFVSSQVVDLLHFLKTINICRTRSSGITVDTK
jgi:hypothetical protein